MPKKIEKEPAEDKLFTVVVEANELISKLVEKYPEILWMINPKEITVLGVTNKERPKSQSWLARITRVAPAMKALLEHYGVPVKYFMELFYSDWNDWNEERRQWIIFHELCHVPSPVDKGLIKHDVEDFSPIIDAVGVRWQVKPTLPSLLGPEPFKFNKDLFVHLHLPKADGDAEIKPPELDS